MEFSTKTEAPFFPTRIELGNRIFSIGSCFAENMADKLAGSGFAVMSNPFGVLYNPASIATALDILTTDTEFVHGDLIENNGLWCSPLFHGYFSHPDAETALEMMNRAVTAGRKTLAEADFIFISFGTPWIYTVSPEFAARQSALPAGEVVANCHKFPPGFYDRRRMETDEIVQIYNRLLQALKGKKVVFTVSPVRYLKDGLHGSNLGKAVLQLAIEGICAANPDAFYFPAYEILTDELRDYRFYGPDMVHPSPTAVEYIWERFRQWALSSEASEAAVEIGKLSSAMEHRVQFPGSDQHRRFLDAMDAKTADLIRKYPKAELSSQTSFFRKDPDKPARE
ncbi:MAG: GSCFA domain-containing protein [Alistipes sp.]|nr:GSCFA domain-containing protein [Alistipes sp.]